MGDSSNRVPSRPGQGAPANQAEVDDFLRRMAAAPGARTSGKRGRLIFALDATASREPTWDRACHLQGEMFEATAALGGLDVQLVYYRGFRECRSSPWVADTKQLLQRMLQVRCAPGHTQIGRVLSHAIKQTEQQRVGALVFVGDSFEESLDDVCHRAGELGLRGVPAFMFHEGGDPVARRAFQEIARLTRGAYCPFDLSSARQLRELLGAVAVYAAGGRMALEHYGQKRGGAALQLTHQVTRR